MDDWRRFDKFKKTPYTKTKLPEDISEKILKLMKLMDLEFGTIDLIRTPNDNFVFLEVNIKGGWWWIEEITKMNISRDIAYYLTQ
jgi:glutathione synthase/RimK-type ligase-like ATP-grasp enzyme